MRKSIKLTSLLMCGFTLTTLAMNSGRVSADNVNTTNEEETLYVKDGTSYLHDAKFIGETDKSDLNSFKELEKNGTKTVVVNATVGKIHMSSTAKDQIDNAKRAGLSVDTYHLGTFTNTEDAEAEAKNYADALTSLGVSKKSRVILVLNSKTSDKVIQTFFDELGGYGYENYALAIHPEQEKINANSLDLVGNTKLAKEADESSSSDKSSDKSSESSDNADSSSTDASNSSSVESTDDSSSDTNSGLNIDFNGTTTTTNGAKPTDDSNDMASYDDNMSDIGNVNGDNGNSSSDNSSTSSNENSGTSSSESDTTDTSESTTAALGSSGLGGTTTTTNGAKATDSTDTSGSANNATDASTDSSNGSSAESTTAALGSSGLGGTTTTTNGAAEQSVASSESSSTADTTSSDSSSSSVSGTTTDSNGASESDGKADNGATSDQGYAQTGGTDKFSTNPVYNFFYISLPNFAEKIVHFFGF